MRATRATLALTTILILTGCSQTNPSSAGSAVVTVTGSGPVAVAASSSGGGASASDSMAPSIPAGHRAVTVPTSSLTFTIPEDQEGLNALPKAQKALLIRAQEVGPSILTQRLNSIDALYGRFSQSGGPSFNSVVVAKEAEISSTPPPQAGLDEITIRQRDTPTGYSTKLSTYGQVTVDTSTVQVQGTQMAGAVVAVPTSLGTYIRTAVTAGSAEEADAVISIILMVAH